MFLKNNFFCLKRSYIFFLITHLFLIFSLSTANSTVFKVSNIQITEPFKENFKKKLVIDKAFEIAFKKLANMTIVSSESYKIKNVGSFQIKNLIDSFNIRDEKFINNSYTATLEVNFNKQNTLLFFEKKNIFPSLPEKKKIIIFPILIDTINNNINLFNKNPFYLKWNLNKKDYHLIDYILPTEEINVIETLNKEINNLEEYDFTNLVKSYDTNEYIICLVYKSQSKFKVFSKIKINEEVKITSHSFSKNNTSQKENIIILIDQVKEIYEDNWKTINKINRSVKLPINLSIFSPNFDKIGKFEKFLSNTEKISKYFIKNFNNEKLNYKIIFNGSPNQFLNLAEKNNFIIDTGNQVWNVK